MIDKIHSVTRIILYVLMALSILAGVLFYALYDFNRTSDQMLSDLNNIYLNQVFIWSFILLGITVLISIISPIYGYIIHPKNVVKLMISIAIFVVVIIIGYVFAGNQFTELRLEELKVTAETSKLVGMGLIVTYISLALAFIAVIYASIVKAFN